MHKLLQDRPGEKIMLLGNEAIARGAVEAGVAFATTYPGTPSSEISLNLFQMSQETDLYFEYSTNEKVALEVAAAAANSGLRTFCMMKHVGLNVAADPLMTLAYVGVHDEACRSQCGGGPAHDPGVCGGDRRHGDPQRG